MDRICYLLSFFAFSFCMILQEKRFGDQSPPNILLLKSAWLTLCLSTEVRNEPQILILFRCLQHMHRYDTAWTVGWGTFVCQWDKPLQVTLVLLCQSNIYITKEESFATPAKASANEWKVNIFLKVHLNLHSSRNLRRLL